VHARMCAQIHACFTNVLYKSFFAPQMTSAYSQKCEWANGLIVNGLMQDTRWDEGTRTREVERREDVCKWHGETRRRKCKV
jgi:hypothetical protein